MKRLLRILMLIVLIGILAYLGACVYGNFFASDRVGQTVDIPDRDEALYSLLVRNTATVIFTNDYEQFGEEVGSRVFHVHGYWELRGYNYKYVDNDVVLSEQVFGEIILQVRGK